MHLNAEMGSGKVNLRLDVIKSTGKYNSSTMSLDNVLWFNIERSDSGN